MQRARSKATQPVGWIRRLPAAVLVLCLAGTLVSCRQLSTDMTLAATQSQVGGIMPVRADPPSVAYRRLMARSESETLTRHLIQAQGLPDYVIEEAGFTSAKLVCFYLKTKSAYLIRINDLHPGRNEIFGPSPIGEKDLRLLNAFEEVQAAARSYSE
jgi:hypothetical protein